MNIWNRFANIGKGKPATAAELKQTRADFVTDRDRLAAELETANGRKAEVLRNGGPIALKPYQEKLREMADQLEAHDLAIAEIERQIAETEKAEAAAAFEQNAKAAATAMRTLDKEVRQSFFAKVDELVEIIKRGHELTAEVKAFNRTAGELGRSDRRINDETMAALNAWAARPTPLEHPLLNPSLARELEAVQHFAAMLERQRERKAA